MLNVRLRVSVWHLKKSLTYFSTHFHIAVVLKTEKKTSTPRNIRKRTATRSARTGKHNFNETQNRKFKFTHTQRNTSKPFQRIPPQSQTHIL